MVDRVENGHSLCHRASRVHSILPIYHAMIVHFGVVVQIAQFAMYIYNQIDGIEHTRVNG